MLRGKRLDEEVAAEAASLALAGARPLRINGYKIEVAKALVKRVILECSAVAG